MSEEMHCNIIIYNAQGLYFRQIFDVDFQFQDLHKMRDYEHTTSYEYNE